MMNVKYTLYHTLFILFVLELKISHFVYKTITAFREHYTYISHYIEWLKDPSNAINKNEYLLDKI